VVELVLMERRHLRNCGKKSQMKAESRILQTTVAAASGLSHLQIGEEILIEIFWFSHLCCDIRREKNERALWLSAKRECERA